MTQWDEKRPYERITTAYFLAHCKHAPRMFSDSCAIPLRRSRMLRSTTHGKTIRCRRNWLRSISIAASCGKGGGEKRYTDNIIPWQIYDNISHTKSAVSSYTAHIYARGATAMVLTSGADSLVVQRFSQLENACAPYSACDNK